MAKEYFPQIGKIPFEGTASKNPMAFHYYDPEKEVCGKKMKDWLKFAMAGGTHWAMPPATSLAAPPAATSGTRQKMPCSAPKTRWMQALKS